MYWNEWRYQFDRDVAWYSGATHFGEEVHVGVTVQLLYEEGMNLATVSAVVNPLLRNLRATNWPIAVTEQEAIGMTMDEFEWCRIKLLFDTRNSSCVVIQGVEKILAGICARWMTQVEKNELRELTDIRIGEQQ